MAYVDPVSTLYSIINSISLGGITFKTSIGWLDQKERDINNYLVPIYTILKVSTVTSSLDTNDRVSLVSMNLQVDVWCQDDAALNTMSGVKLNEFMVNKLRDKIRENRSHPSTTIKQLTIIDEQNKDEFDVKPIIRRTMVMIRATCLRD